jgi:2-oxo-4-hydroxy-4-carboxy--5-ureidoimidazoline (OHCU) decarboxylase
MAEWALEELSTTNPARALHTALLAALRISPETEYRAWLEHKPELAAALVSAGRARAKRLQVALARYIVAEASYAV